MKSRPQRYTLISLPQVQQTLIHVHPDSEILGSVFRPELAIQSGPAEFAAAAAALPANRSDKWSAWAAAARHDYEDSLAPPEYDGALDLGQVMVWLREHLPDDAIIALDGGNFSGWPMRFLKWRHPRTQLGPQAGAMGHGVPAAVAAKLVHPDRVVVCFAGDGGFMMTGQELATAVQYGASPIILVFNNGMYGTIRMHQERDYPNARDRHRTRQSGFLVAAQSYRCHGETVSRTDEFGPAYERALRSGKPAVIELRMDPDVITTRTTLNAIRSAALARK